MRLSKRLKQQARCGVARFAMAALLIGLTGPALAETQELGPSDRIQLRIVEWRAGRADYVEWTPMTGEYTVSPSGTVLLPLAGEVQAAGRTPAALAEAIVAELQTRTGMPNRPTASVEVVQFRPIYVTGEVERPGEHPFRPGLSVLQAVSLAGGLYRLPDSGAVRLEREQVTASGTLQTAQLERQRFLVRRARLQAELGTGPIRLPEQLAGDPRADRLLADEQRILEIRREALRSRLAALDSLKDLLTREIASMQQKIETQARQIAIARRELRDVSSLRDRGLSITARETGLERVIAELEGRLIDYETAVLRARQDISRAERDALDQQTEMQSRAASELSRTEAELEQNSVRITTAAALLDEISEAGPRLLLERTGRRTRNPVFSVVRQENGQAVERQVTETALLRAGDTVRVRFEPPATSIGAPPTQSGTGPVAWEHSVSRNTSDAATKSDSTRTE